MDLPRRLLLDRGAARGEAHRHPRRADADLERDGLLRRLRAAHASERHDLNSYETHAGTWIAFRQPVLRRFAEEQGRPVAYTYEANPGEVWEEDEFWIELSWRIDPDGALGIREHFESPYRPGEKVSVEEYYRSIFERVPGLPEAAQGEGLTAYRY
ncbi:MAG: hypothetical protein GWO03_02000, partial [Gammaproteobacteria bacterium]|nr:hypothetical protein [Candidatus Kutchimonas denitrificans]NIR96870.1 hypothetical protein [Gammaproteobacteria bacterium]